MVPNIVIQTCPHGRCSKCEYAPFPECLPCKTTLCSEDIHSNVMLIEPERRMIHICWQNSKPPSGPPWTAPGWESLYVSGDVPLHDLLTNLFDVYTIGPYVFMYCKDSPDTETSHYILPVVHSELEAKLVQDLYQKISSHRRFSNSRISIHSALQETINDVENMIKETIPEINESTRLRISQLVAHKCSVLGIFLPLLLDDLIEEIYVDRPESQIYFDHRLYGRCTSHICVPQKDVERITTVIRAESNLHLDRSNPSLKTDILLDHIRLRVSMSLPPLCPDGLHVDIRKQRIQAFDILDLVRNGTLTLEAAAVLIFAFSSRFNIAITGGPGSGKTTLLNALDFTTPPTWRKVYIEDALESRLMSYGHQLRFRVNPVDELSGSLSKSDEIIKTLHRTPDYVILGEIQTMEHSQALFQAMSAGLRTAQTCHSDSAAVLVTRWMNNHAIPSSSIALMDVIVTLRRPRPGSSQRQVSEIVEIKRQVIDGSLRFSGLNLIYDGQTGKMTETWAEDGAFLNRAREYGAETHIPAYLAFVEKLRRLLHRSDCCTTQAIGSILWRNGNPFLFELENDFAPMQSVGKPLGCGL